MTSVSFLHFLNYISIGFLSFSAVIIFITNILAIIGNSDVIAYHNECNSCQSTKCTIKDCINNKCKEIYTVPGCCENNVNCTIQVSTANYAFESICSSQVDTCSPQSHLMHNQEKRSQTITNRLGITGLQIHQLLFFNSKIESDDLVIEDKLISDSLKSKEKSIILYDDKLMFYFDFLKIGDITIVTLMNASIIEDVSSIGIYYQTIPSEFIPEYDNSFSISCSLNSKYFLRPYFYFTSDGSFTVSIDSNFALERSYDNIQCSDSFYLLYTSK